MASLSSTSSVSSSSSLGNTSLRGFGGMVSGIDRDSIIEAMTLNTQTKIANYEKQYTKLQWKQEAYRSISDQIIDWADKYASYSSTSSLLDASTFAKSKITLHGKEESRQYVQASGSSQFVDNVSIASVQQLATSTVRQSHSYANGVGLQTSLKKLDQDFKSSNLQGTKLTFGVGAYKDGNFTYAQTKTFTLPSSYTYEENGETKTKTINYTPEDATGFKKLAEDLNKALKEEDLEVDGRKIHEIMEFKYNESNKHLEIVLKDGADAGNVVISHYSSALDALGYKLDTENAEDYKNGIQISDFAKGQTGEFATTGISTSKALDAMTGQKITFNYDGSKKEIELITKEEAEKLNDDKLSEKEQREKFRDFLQTKLDRAYGTGAIEVSFDPDSTDSPLSFKTIKDTSTISITSNDSDMLRSLGLTNGASNKVNLNDKLSQNAFEDLKLGNLSGELDLSINGVKIEGLTENSTISEILSKINSTTDAGVKATYVESEGRFMLLSSETGAGREISLDSDLTKRLFGDYSYYDETDKKYKFDFDKNENENAIEYGKDAIIHVSYGNGRTVKLERASNTFDLEGLSVTVSGVFGGESKNDEWIINTSDAVTFSAKADVDGVTEKVKSFFEDFNALVKEINKQVTTRPDSSYEPLTDEQRAEMDDTSIENWEKKAKEGILFGDSTMRSLSSDIEMIFSELLSSGASYEDLKEIGITYSEDYLDGGTLVFDENAFRSAMESDPEKVSNIFAGGGGVKKGLVEIIDDTFTPYATRYASKNAGDGGSGSYGQLIDIAGSEKKPTTLIKNQIYEQLKQMQETIDTWKERLEIERDRYISQFTYMETMINQYNSQSGYLSQITG